MRKLLLPIILSLIPLSGCSSPEPELSYDPIELIEYEQCLNNPPEAFKGIWNLDNFGEQFCKDKKPVLK